MADGNRVPDLGTLSDSATLLGVNSVGTTGLFPFKTLRDKISDYDSVAAIQASSEAARGPGSLWSTKQGVNFIEAVSTATDFHLDTAEGVKLYVVPKNGIYSLAAFGAAMDGVTDDIEICEKARDVILRSMGTGIFGLDVGEGVTALSRPFILFPDGEVYENIVLKGQFKAVGGGFAIDEADTVLNRGTANDFETKDYLIRLSNDIGTGESGKPLNITLDGLVLDCNEMCNGVLVANGEGVIIERPFIHSFVDSGVTLKNHYKTYGTRGTDIHAIAPRIYRKKSTDELSAESADLYTSGNITGYGIYSSGQDLQVFGGTIVAKTPVFNERGSAYLNGVHLWCVAGPDLVPGATALEQWQNWIEFHSGVVASTIVVDGQTYFDNCVPVITQVNGSVNLTACDIVARIPTDFGGYAAAVVFSNLGGGGDTLSRCKIAGDVSISVKAAWNTVGTVNGTAIEYLSYCDINTRELFVGSYTTGTVTATNGSPIVVGAATGWLTAWNDDWVGRLIKIGGSWYTVASIDSPTQLTLTTNYGGAGGAGLSYEVQSAPLKRMLDRVDIYCSITNPSDNTSGAGYYRSAISFAEWSNDDFTPGATTFGGTINNAPRVPLQTSVPVRLPKMEVTRIAAAAGGDAALMAAMASNPPFARRLGTEDVVEVFWPAGMNGDFVLTGWRSGVFDRLT